MSDFLFQASYGFHPEVMGFAPDEETLRARGAWPPLLTGYSFYQIAGKPPRVGRRRRPAQER